MSERNLFQKIFHDRVYCVCYKRISDTPFFKEKNNERFNVIKPNLLYWYADPFVFNYNSKEYLFVEKCNRITGKGIISMFEINENSNSKIKDVLIEEFHLSFPNVFMFNDDVYMIPESEEDKAINIYKMDGEICKWNIFVRYPIKGIVDIAALKENDNLILIASKENDRNVRMSKSVAFKIDGFPKHLKIKDTSNVYFDDKKYSYVDRNGGNIISEKNNKYRIIQNSTKDIYGKNISVKRFNKIGKEKEVSLIVAQDIKTRIKICDEKDLLGIHTYNTDGKYETVDLYYENYNFFNIFIKLFSIIYKVIKK